MLRSTFFGAGALLLVSHAQAALLNELNVNPPSTDQPFEYIEITGSANEALTNVYFVSMEGDFSGANTGLADMVVSLNGLNLGSNGLLMIKATTGGHTPPAATTVVTDAQFDSGALENGTNSFLLIQSTTPITEGTDYDTNEDGVLDLPGGATVIDAVGWSDGGGSDKVYGGVVLTQTSGTPDAATRFPGNTTANSVAAWYNGDLSGATNDSVTYNAAAASTNFPAGGLLTPGDTNVPVPAAVQTNCPATLNTTVGTATSANVSASDTDGIINAAAITSAPVAGISLINFVAAPATGSTATATLDVANTVTLGSYAVEITFTSGAVTDARIAVSETGVCTVQVNVSALVLIRDIQGKAHRSPLLGQVVVDVPGIVTQLTSNGFFFQDPNPDTDPGTSEGLFVFTSSAPTVAVGDSVKVSGTVAEFRPGGGTSANLSITEITGPTITLVSNGNALPAPIIIGTDRTPPSEVIDNDTVGGDVELNSTFDFNADGIDFWESLEGMRVQLNNAVATSPTREFSSSQTREIALIANNGAGASVLTTRGGILVRQGDFNPERLIMQSAIANLPLVNVGNSFPQVTGVIDYNFSNFKLIPDLPVTAPVADLQPEVTALLGDTYHLTVGSFNVENLDPSDGAGKFDALAGQVVSNLKSPDIVALMEIQDNNGATNDGAVDAATTFNTLITAIQAAGGPAYQFRQINPVNNQDGGEPGGNIRVGFLFNPARVSFVDRGACGSVDATAVNPGPQLSCSPGRVDPANVAWDASRKPLAGEFTFQGQTVFVIANHFNSKGGDQPLYGRFQPPTLTSETQRLQQATVLHDFIQQIITQDASAKVVALGDFNDFEFSNPMQTLTGNGALLHDLIEDLPAGERYTYVFDGNSQALDHILTSLALVGKTEYDVVHVNAEFAVQNSDHDPEVARLDLAPEDGDGVTAQTEDGAPNGGDGNGDGLRDAQQPSVISLPNATDGNYLTLEITGNCAAAMGVQSYTEASQGGGDPDFNHPLGLLGFSLPCETATITVLYHGVANLNGYTYRKYGPLTPGNPATTQWYTFPTAGFGTRQVGAQTVATATLNLADNQLGDDTGDDGQIVDQGGPALAAVAVPLLSHAALALLASLLLLTGLMLHKRRKP